jgi:hypothetical protein
MSGIGQIIAFEDWRTTEQMRPQLTKSGHFTSLRRLFAFFADDECYGDVSDKLSG